MPRAKRLIISGRPHHVTQRGNRRQQTFFSDADYRAYEDLLIQWTDKEGVDLTAYVLMPNHVHLILVPHLDGSLARVLREVHTRYTRRVNFHKDWRGHLWQGRFYSVPLNDEHFENAVRYVELNPVRGALADQPWQYRWSSAHAHRRGEDFYSQPFDVDVIRKMTRTGKLPSPAQDEKAIKSDCPLVTNAEDGVVGRVMIVTGGVAVGEVNPPSIVLKT